MDERVTTVERGLQPAQRDHVKHFTRLALNHLFKKKDIAERLVSELQDHAQENGAAVTPEVQRLLLEWDMAEAGQ